MRSIRAIVDRVRDILEGHDDLGESLLQALAGAQVKRHTGPAPGIDLDLQRNEGFGRTVGRNAFLFQVSDDWLALGRPCLILTAHCLRKNVARSEEHTSELQSRENL